MSKILYVSIDIEADGPAPGLNSMLALGAAAFTPEGTELTHFYATLTPLPDAAQDPGTMKWWETQPEAWKLVTRSPVRPEHALPQFASWCENLPGNPVAVASPAAYDFAWINYYLWRFARRNPLGFSCRDIGSYAKGMGLDDRERREIWKKVNRTGLRPHVAVDDAIEQGAYWCDLLAKARELATARAGAR